MVHLQRTVKSVVHKFVATSTSSILGFVLESRLKAVGDPFVSGIMKYFQALAKRMCTLSDVTNRDVW